MAYIKRDLEQVVSQLTQEYPVILLTTLLGKPRRFLPDHIML